MTNVITQELVDTLGVFLNPKFVITHDTQGEPNIALVMTWTVYEGDTLVYGDFMTYKTRINLEEGNSQIGILAMTTDLDSWLIKANFESFHRNDDVYEFMAMTPLFRYNQYTNARSAGTATAIWASENYKVSKLSVLTTYLKAKLAGGKVPKESTEEGNLPFNILQRFNKMAAIKILSFIDEDGYPAGFPSLGMMAPSENRLVVNRNEEKRRGFSLSDGQSVAVSLVTLEPQAFQVKGVFKELNPNTGYIEIDRVYTCSLPRPGARVDISPIKRVEFPGR